MCASWGTYYPRGDEITAWMKDNYTPDYYVIIDDNPDMTIHGDHLVNTELKVGLTKTHTDQAYYILNTKIKAPELKFELYEAPELWK